MSTPKKKAVVSKRPSAEQIQDSKKWNEMSIYFESYNEFEVWCVENNLDGDI